MSTQKKKGGNALNRQSENMYVQSNQLVEAHYKEALSMWEMFLFSKMCSMIEAEDTDFKPYKIYIKEALAYLGVKKGGQNYRYVVEAAQRLLDRRITTYYVNASGKTIAVDTHLVSSVHRLAEPEEDDSLFVALTFPPELKPMLLHLKDNFTILNLDVFKHLKTPTSVRMYQLLTAHLWKKDKKVVYELEDLKRKLGVVEKYEQYGAFKVYVLNEAQKRLDESNFVSFTYKEIKSGKRIVAIEFYLIDKRGNNPLALISPISHENKNIELGIVGIETEAYDRIIAELSPIVILQFGVTLKIFEQLVRQHTEGGLRQAVKVTQNAMKTRRIDNPAGYFVEALRGHYTDFEPLKATPKAPQKIAEKAVVKTEKTPQTTPKNDEKRLVFERENSIFQSLVATDIDFQEAIIAEVKRGMFVSYYRSELSFAQNLQNPLLAATFMAVAKKLRPEAFV